MLRSARAEYLAKSSVKSIGVKLGVSVGSVTRVLRIMGVEIRPRGGLPSLTLKQKAEVALLLQTHTQQEVADQYGVGRYAVQRVYAAEKRNAQQ